MKIKRKNKFGFTLIEILAVILILAIIAIIAIPVTAKILEEAKKNAFKVSAQHIADAAANAYALRANSSEYYYVKGVEYTTASKKLSYTGKRPLTGRINVTTEGIIALALYNGKYCATKAGDQDAVTVKKSSIDECVTYNIIETDDTWEEIANEYDTTPDFLLGINEEDDINSDTSGRKIKVPIRPGSEYVSGENSSNGPFYKTYYSLSMTTYSESFSSSTYTYTIELGVLPLPIEDIDTAKVTAKGVYEKLVDFEQYVIKKKMGEVIWPAGEEVKLTLEDAPRLQEHAARNSNMTADDVSVTCDSHKCYATITETVDNLNGVNPYNDTDVYLPVKFTVEFNGTPELCAVTTTTDGNPGVLSGTGTSEDPYLIESIEDLVALSNSVNGGNTYSGKYLSLIRTFDFESRKSYKDYQTIAYGDVNGDGTVEGLLSELTTDSGFNPIGNNVNSFRGVLIGNLNCIDNLYVNRPSVSYVGFVGYNNGKIMGINLNNIDVTGANYTAGLAGFNGGSVINSTVNGDVTGANYVGFASGYVDYNTATTSIVANGNISGVSNVGGLIGYDYTGASVRGVYSGGSVIGTGSSIGRTIGAMRGGSNDGTLALNTITVNGSTVNSNSSTGTNGSSITSLSDLNDINLSETAFDTYIGGDNDGDGYYWDYDDSNKVVRKTVQASPIPFNLSGSGTTVAPYLIYTYDDLRQASLKQNVVYKLMADIDLSGKNYYMLGSYQNKFSGTFDGNIKSITNMDINDKYGSYVGFVGYNNGKVMGINLNNIDVTGANYTAGLAGFNGGSVINSTVSGDVTGANYVGFASGYVDYNTVATSIVANGNISGVSNVGGLIGYDYTGASVRGVYSGGSVIGTGSSIGRTIGAMRGGSNDGTLALNTITVNGSTVNSNSSTGTNGSSITSLSDLNDINLSETAFDTYIGGDNDGDGYYWDYDDSNKVVRKTVQASPIPFNLSGSGTTVAPYLIYTYDDLRQASLKQNVVYKLMADIDLSGKNYYMLGSYQNKFSGTFDGAARTISNMIINNPYGSYVGFVGYNNGKIMGINLNNVDITGANYTAGISGFDGGNISNIIISGNLSGASFVGFATGYIDYGKTATSIIANGNITGVSNVGGLVGYDYTGSTIKGVYKSGSVVGTGSGVSRTIGAMRGGSTDSTAAYSGITVNSAIIFSSSSSSTQGLDVSSSDLQIDTTYINRSFNFTNEALDYIWYMDSGIAKFREGNL